MKDWTLFWPGIFFTAKQKNQILVSFFSHGRCYASEHEIEITMCILSSKEKTCKITCFKIIVIALEMESRVGIINEFKDTAP